jgi:hypothetical protein
MICVILMKLIYLILLISLLNGCRFTKDFNHLDSDIGLIDYTTAPVLDAHISMINLVDLSMRSSLDMITHDIINDLGMDLGTFDLGQNLTDVIHVIEAGAVCDGQYDDTQILRQIIAHASPYSTLIFPNTDTGFCKLTGHLTIDKPLQIKGLDGAKIKRTDYYPDGSNTSPFQQCAAPGYLCQSPCEQNCGGAMFYVIHSHVSIENLALIGHDYGSARIGNTHGIWVIGASDDSMDWLSNITIRNNHLQYFRGSGISLVRVNDFIIENNHVTEIGYSGINVIGRRGRIHNNQIIDINHPTFCPLSDDVSTCQFLNGYGIVVTGCGAKPCSEDIIISYNEVRENQHWVGMMNHGGQRILFDSNQVWDTDVLYAQTVSACPSTNLDCEQQASDDTIFINNLGDTLPITQGGRYSMDGTALIGPAGIECMDHSDCSQQEGACIDCPKGCSRCVCELEGSLANYCRYLAPSRGTGLWLLGFSQPQTRGPMAIGNTLRNIGQNGQRQCMMASATQSLTVTHNICESDQGEQAPFRGITLSAQNNHIHQDGTIAHNQWNPTNSNGVNYFESAIYADGEGINDLLVVRNQLINPIEFAVQLNGGSWDIRDNDFQQAQATFPINGLYTMVSIEHPPVMAPHHFTVNYEENNLRFTWIYPEFSIQAHDSFLIQFSTHQDGPWESLAFRPAHHVYWKFNAPTNPHWIVFNPLQFEVPRPSNHPSHFRIRAHYKSSVSSWTYIH